MTTTTPPNQRRRQGLSPDDIGDINGEREVPGENMHGILARAEIDQQISTAHAYPRSLTKFLAECMQMATLNEKIAGECIYALPRKSQDGGTKNIEGPSARLAEIVASAWGNCRAGARVVDEGPEFITAQGVFHDLERNVAITYEVRRRITDKSGRRFSSDMIAVTGNAASSIALRNAVFKGVPKAFWSSIYEAARTTAVGNAQTLSNRRSTALAHMQKLGATPETVFAFLGVKGEQDITLDHLATLRGIANSIRDEEISVEEAFAPKEQPKEAPKVDLGEIPLEPPSAKAAANPKPQAKPATNRPTLERPAVEACLAAMNAAGMKIEELFADATRLAGKPIGSTRDLASLDDTMLGTLAQEIAAFGTEPEATR